MTGFWGPMTDKVEETMTIYHIRRSLCAVFRHTIRVPDFRSKKMRRTIEAAMLSLPLILTQAENAGALSPQLERSRQLFEAFQHLNQIAHMLSDPIDKIEYGSKGDIRFTGGTCTVAVIIHEKLLTQKEIENGDAAGYTSEVGPVLCQP